MATGTVGFRFDPEWRITLFTLVMVSVMVNLGFWQLQREEEKAELSLAWEQRQAQPPAPLEELWHDGSDQLAYRPVTVTGRYREGEYFLLDNRILKGKFGYEVLALMELEDSGDTVLVNRGWIAGDPARLSQPVIPEIAGLVTERGHVYVAPGEAYLLQEQQLAPGWPKLIQAVEMDKITAAAGVVRLFPHPVRLDAEAPGALAIDWKVVNVSPEKHRGYAVQWFTMAAVLTVFYFLRCSNAWQLLTGRENRGE
jgi:cytochrome oxidase assembly protein ShyY1